MKAKNKATDNPRHNPEIHAPLGPGEWLNLLEAAERLNKTERFVRRLVLERKVRYYKHGHFLAFRKADLDAWANVDCREPAQ